MKNKPIIFILILLLFIPMSIAYTNTSIDMLLKFEGNPFDSSVNDNDGIEGGSPVYYDSKGDRGTGSLAINLDGTSDFVNIINLLNDVDVDDGEYSISFWFNYTGDGASSDRHLLTFSDADTSNNYFVLVLRTSGSGGAIQMASNYGGTTSSGIGTTNILSGWRHIVYTVSSGDVAKLYVDGDLENTSVRFGTLSSSIDTMRIGSFKISGSEDFFSGTVDEVTVFNIELDASDVTDIYTSGVDISIEEEPPINETEPDIQPFGFPDETIIFSESFGYSDAFSNHGWNHWVSWGAIPSTPVDYTSDLMSPNVFGWNQSISVGTAGTFSILLRDFPNNESFSSGTMTMAYDIEDFGILDDASTSFQTRLEGTTADNQIQISNGKWDGINGGVTTIGFIGLGGEDCVSSFNYTTPFRARFIMQMDIPNNLYNAFYLINGTEYQDIGCIGKQLYDGTMPPLVKMRITERWEQSTIEAKFLDNFISAKSILTLSMTGQPCLQNNECASGKCEYNACVLLGGTVACDSDNQCLSGECHNNLCVKASLWDSVDASKRQQFGDDSNTNNFISLFFMLGLPLLIILSTRSRAGILGGIVVYFGMAFFFTIVGYLSPFILIGSIISGLILFVLVMMMGGSSS